MLLSPVVGADDETKVQPTLLGQLTVCLSQPVGKMA